MLPISKSRKPTYQEPKKNSTKGRLEAYLSSDDRKKEIYG